MRGGNDLLVGGGGERPPVRRLRGSQGQRTHGLHRRGADRFVFANGSGLDTIFDFQDDFDLIDLTGFAGITGFGDLSPSNVSQIGADTVIDLGAAAGGAGDQDVLTLAGFDAGDLDQTDFLFA